jgi:hypothetical protein
MPRVRHPIRLPPQSSRRQVEPVTNPVLISPRSFLSLDLSSSSQPDLYLTRPGSCGLSSDGIGSVVRDAPRGVGRSVQWYLRVGCVCCACCDVAIPACSPARGRYISRLIPPRLSPIPTSPLALASRHKLRSRVWAFDRPLHKQNQGNVYSRYPHWW